MTDLINPHEMEVCKVASASWSVNSLETMGTLVSKGILIKEYVSTGIPDAHEIHWTNWKMRFYKHAEIHFWHDVV